MDPKEKQKLIILFVIFGVAAVIMYHNLLLKPQLSGFAVCNREYRAIKARVKSAEALIKNEARIKHQHEELKKQAELLEKRLPGQDEISGLLEDFSRIAESSGVRILKIKPLEVAGGPRQSGAKTSIYVEFPILIEARGGYHQCGMFINKLETMQTFIKVEDVDIRAVASDPRHHDIKLRLKTYITK